MPEFIFGTPDEIRQQIENAQTQAEMHSSLHRHELIRVFDELDDEKLLSVRGLLAAIVNNDDSAAMANFFCGYASAIAHARGICAACGEKHDDASAITDQEGCS